MGLDINVLAKPKAGHEAEFETIWRDLEVANGNLPPLPGEEVGLIGRLLGRWKKVETAPLIERFQEISIPPYAAIGAPVVGRDVAANAWLRELFENGTLMTDATDFDSALAEFDGFHAIDAMPDCDGFPIYTHANLLKGVDRTSFRGAFLKDCKAIIGDDLFSRAWVSMLAPDLGAWASELRKKADDFAEVKGLQHVLGDKYAEVDLEGPDGKLHIVDQAARWAAFWSERGHGTEPYY